jgi:hypothetical protein
MNEASPRDSWLASERHLSQNKVTTWFLLQEIAVRCILWAVTDGGTAALLTSV